MNRQGIRYIVKGRGDSCNNLKKSEPVQTLQAAEGGEQCFMTGKASELEQKKRLWKASCK